MHPNEDTIVALATPRGAGAIAVIRLSGPDSFRCADRVFRGRSKVHRAQPGLIVHGFIVDAREDNKTLDRVMLTAFRAPNSYTGEDVVEISCHGGPLLVEKVLDSLTATGARPAAPGEFTRRAFLNGKLDLLQAESVADLINAQSEKSLSLSFDNLSGRLSDRCRKLKEALVRQCALLELELDFSDQDVEFASREQIREEIVKLNQRLDRLIASHRSGMILRQGANTVIIGRPNVGKSSLLNRLLERERAIVSEIPGTTRDTLEESLDINGLLFNITDTAGWRNSKEVLEREGVQRTRSKMEHADLLLLVLDRSEELETEDHELLRDTEAGRRLIVLNKIDLPERARLRDTEKDDVVIRTSAKQGTGLDDLKEAMVGRVLDASAGDEGIIIARARHRDALRRAHQHLQHALDSLERDLGADFIVLDLRAALDALGELTGEVTTEEILQQIFSSFCIGK